MNLNKTALALIAVATMTLTSQAVAILTFEDAIGSISPGQPADPAAELVFVNTLLDFNTTGIYVVNYSEPDFSAQLAKKSPYTFQVFDSSHYGDTAIGGEKVDGNVPGITGLTGPYFVLGKYGSTDFVWHVAGGDAIIPSAVPGQGGSSLSHRTTFGAVAVPDGGSTVVLLGIALAGLGILHRKTSSR